MKLSRRRFLHLVATAAALPALSRIVWAQAYPTRPVRVLEGFGSGSSADLAARLIGHWLSERLGQYFVIENRPGAGSNVATEAVVRAAPDGYTLLTCVTANAINATLYEKLNFNFIRDIAPVGGLLRMSLVVLVNPSLAAKTLPEFIAYAKANPGKVNIAVPGNGSGPHVAGELFKMMAEINIVDVPYRGPAPAFTDLISGQVQVMFVALPAAIGYIGRASCGHWPLPVHRARRSYRTCQRSRNLSKLTRRAVGSGSVRPGAPPPQSSTSSTAISLPDLPTRSSRLGSKV